MTHSLIGIDGTKIWNPGDTTKTFSFASAPSGHAAGNLMLLIAEQRTRPTVALTPFTVGSDWTELALVSQANAAGRGQTRIWWRQAIHDDKTLEPDATISLPTAGAFADTFAYATLTEYLAQLWPLNPTTETVDPVGPSPYKFQPSTYSATRVDTIAQVASLGRPGSGGFSLDYNALNGWTSTGYTSSLIEERRSQQDATPGAYPSPVYESTLANQLLAITFTLASTPPTRGGWHAGVVIR